MTDTAQAPGTGVAQTAQTGRQALEAAVVASREKLVRLVPEAIDTIEDLMHNSTQDPVRLGAAKDLLDRAGVTVKQQIEVDARVSGTADSKIEDLLTRLARNSESRAAAAAAAAQAEAEAGIEDAVLVLIVEPEPEPEPEETPQ